MFDAEDLKDDGLDLEGVAHVAELAMCGIHKMKSKEAEWLIRHLEYIRDQCELNAD